MTNFDAIKKEINNMNAYKFADFLFKNNCEHCFYQHDKKGCIGLNCTLGIETWLNKEQEEKHYRPYAKVDVNWTGKALLFKNIQNCSTIIIRVNANSSQSIITFDDGLPISLESFFNLYTWIDGSPCGEEVCDKTPIYPQFDVNHEYAIGERFTYERKIIECKESSPVFSNCSRCIFSDCKDKNMCIKNNPKCLDIERKDGKCIIFSEVDK